MNTYYITFGQKYRYEKHPNYSKAKPDGWVEIIASSEEKARNFAFLRFDKYWSFIYTKETMQFQYFPKGCIDTFVVKD